MITIALARPKHKICSLTQVAKQDKITGLLAYQLRIGKFVAFLRKTAPNGFVTVRHLELKLRSSFTSCFYVEQAKTLAQNFIGGMLNTREINEQNSEKTFKLELPF